MKAQYLYALLAAVMFLTAQSLAFTLSPKRLAMGEITLHGSLNATCISTRGGTAYLHIEIETQGVPEMGRAYRPKNIAVVLDRSGSMADEQKLDYAKRAISSLVDQLGAADELSIVIYDNEVYTLLPHQRVTDKERIKELLRRVTPGGSTNLGGGLAEGFRQLEESPTDLSINRVILLSDGLANQGITDPRELERIAHSYRNRSVSLTTMGVGLDYNEDLMMGLAEAGGGNYYFIEQPRQLAAFFERELGGITTVVAQNAVVGLTLGRGVAVKDVIGYEWNNEDGRITIPVGDLSSNDRREITVELEIPEGRASKRIASGELLFPGADLRHPASFSVDIRYSDDLSEIKKGTNWDVQAKTEVALSTRSVEHAMKALDEGRPEEAGRQLGAARQALSASEAVANAPSAAPMMQKRIDALTSYAKELRDSTADMKKIKKSVQFQNYEAQKKKP